MLAHFEDVVGTFFTEKNVDTLPRVGDDVEWSDRDGNERTFTVVSVAWLIEEGQDGAEAIVRMRPFGPEPDALGVPATGG